MRTILATMMMLLMTTAALAGCAGSDVTSDDVDTARDEGYAQGVADTTPVSTLDTIVERGSMKCGVKESQYGMGYLDATTGVRSGLDIAYCRAVAAFFFPCSCTSLLPPSAPRAASTPRAPALCSAVVLRVSWIVLINGPTTGQEHSPSSRRRARR